MKTKIWVMGCNYYFGFSLFNVIIKLWQQLKKDKRN